MTSITGRFRNDMIAAAAASNDGNKPRSMSQVPATPYNNWLDRMQKTRGRHAAITKNLYTWSNYKSWTEKMRESWDAQGKPRGDKGDPRQR
ncbi:MAG: hypothetical protein NZM12_13715, partial [Steroidobacteraceae bacterium]|nr:hypothetical protein [Steroidobacteraceae bacterium]MDW8260317.1 hypothetical protein [Gammaproteobacteria bacterium]